MPGVGTLAAFPANLRMEPVNFLAHLHLADPEPGLMLGGIVADFARNPEIAVLPDDVQRGVRLHRLIDGFTDRHPLVHRSIACVSPRLGWFSGIVIDIYYDHILARTWERYSAEPLPLFAGRAYRLLDELYSLAPPDSQQFIRRFIDNDQLVSYSTIKGIAFTLARVSRRIAERIPRKAVWLPDSIPDLTMADADLTTDFHSFYPELMAFTAEQRRSDTT
jgi:acyl carrier protein phosphodiesterase